MDHQNDFFILAIITTLILFILILRFRAYQQKKCSNSTLTSQNLKRLKRLKTLRKLKLFESKKNKKHIFLNYYMPIYDDHNAYAFFMANHYSQFVALTKLSEDSWHFVFEDGWCAVFNDKKRLLTLDEIEKVASIFKL